MGIIYNIEQSINIPGIMYTIKIIKSDRSKLIPHFDIKDINDLDPKRLKEYGFSGILFDMDNTLSRPYAYEVHPSIQDKLKEFKEEYSRKIAIISNSAGIPNDKHYRKAEKIKNAFEINVVKHRGKKPAGIEDVLAHFEIKDPTKLVMIGDRVFTDVAFGNRYGMLTVLVQPFTLEGDNYIAKKLRNWERRKMYQARKRFGIPTHKLMKK